VQSTFGTYCIASVQDSDLILVMDGGQVVASGKHDELIKAKGYYYNLYTRQFQEESINAIL